MRRMTRALEHSEFVDRLEDVLRQHGDVRDKGSTVIYSYIPDTWYLFIDSGNIFLVFPTLWNRAVGCGLLSD